jgi:hypothetical protein
MITVTIFATLARMMLEVADVTRSKAKQEMWAPAEGIRDRASMMAIEGSVNHPLQVAQKVSKPFVSIMTEDVQDVTKRITPS